MRTPIALAVLLGAGLCGAGCVMPVVVSEYHAGEVRDVTTGAPLAGATVVHDIYRREPETGSRGPIYKTNELVTDADGRYVIDTDRDWMFVWPTRAEWPEFTARIRVEKPGYRPAEMRQHGDRLPEEVLLDPLTTTP